MPHFKHGQRLNFSGAATCNPYLQMGKWCHNPICRPSIKKNKLYSYLRQGHKPEALAFRHFDRLVHPAREHRKNAYDLKNCFEYQDHMQMTETYASECTAGALGVQRTSQTRQTHLRLYESVVADQACISRWDPKDLSMRIHKLALIKFPDLPLWSSITIPFKGKSKSWQSATLHRKLADECVRSCSLVFLKTPNLERVHEYDILSGCRLAAFNVRIIHDCCKFQNKLVYSGVLFSCCQGRRTKYDPHKETNLSGNPVPKTSNYSRILRMSRPCD